MAHKDYHSKNDGAGQVVRISAMILIVAVIIGAFFLKKSPDNESDKPGEQDTVSQSASGQTEKNPDQSKENDDTPAVSKPEEGYITLIEGESIQGAVDRMKEGDVLKLESGSFEETVTIKTNGISIIGANAGLKASKVRDNDTLITGGFVLEKGVKNVTIDGLQIKAGHNTPDHGNVAIYGKGGFENIAVQNCVLVGDSYGDAVVFQPDGESDAIHSLQITGCHVTAFSTGVALDSAAKDISILASSFFDVGYVAMGEKMNTLDISRNVLDKAGALLLSGEGVNKKILFSDNVVKSVKGNSSNDLIQIMEGGLAKKETIALSDNTCFNQKVSELSDADKQKLLEQLISFDGSKDYFVL